MWTVLTMSAVLVGCPRTAQNRPADARDGSDVADVEDERVGRDDVADATSERAGVNAGDGAADDAASDVGSGEVGDGAVRDGGDAGAATDAGVQMTIEFSSAALVSAPGGGVQMRANLTWHGALRGSAGGVTFEGEIR